MKSNLILLLFMLVLPPAYGGAPVLSDRAYGAIIFGQPLEAAETQLSEKAQTTKDPEEEHCRYVSFMIYPHISFMVENGVITRAESSSAIPTSKGITVGASLKAAKRKRPTVVEPHKYEDNGHYIIFRSSGAKRALLLEEVNGTVTAVRGGLVPSVEYVEGCL